MTEPGVVDRAVDDAGAGHRLPTGRLVAAALGGGSFIAVGDHLFHVRTGVLHHVWYPQWDHQTLLVFPMFMGAALAMLLVARPLARPLPRPTTVRLAAAAAAFYAAYALTGQVGTDHPWWCLAILLISFVARLPFEPRPRAVVLVGLLIGVGGCLGEAAVSELGLFTYVHADVLGVPLWLLPLYLHGAPAVLGLTRLVFDDPPEPTATQK